MLKFKNKEGKVVLTENSETGEVKIFDESLKELKEEIKKQEEDLEEEK